MRTAVVIVMALLLLPTIVAGWFGRHDRKLAQHDPFDNPFDDVPGRGDSIR